MVKTDSKDIYNVTKDFCNYDFSLNKFLICCLLIVSKVVVKFRYYVE